MSNKAPEWLQQFNKAIQDIQDGTSGINDVADSLHRVGLVSLSEEIGDYAELILRASKSANKAIGMSIHKSLVEANESAEQGP